MLKKIVVAFHDGSTAYLRDVAVGGRDSYGKRILAMCTCKNVVSAWKGSPEDKDEIIQDFHRLMALGFCRDVSYLY